MTMTNKKNLNLYIIHHVYHLPTFFKGMLCNLHWLLRTNFKTSNLFMTLVHAFSFSLSSFKRTFLG